MGKLPSESVDTSLSLNYLSTLSDKLSSGRPSPLRISLAFQRAQLHSKNGYHQEALEDFHYVEEHRDLLTDRSQQFLSELRELKQREYEYVRRLSGDIQL